ncbi:MAG: family 43 glycosylhydrolase [Reichenbachiella sp.]
MLAACNSETTTQEETTSLSVSVNNDFPFFIPSEKPERPLSAGVARGYDTYGTMRPEQNELYTQFKYTKLKGLDYNGSNGTVSRRDPSKVIFENGKYYVWYTGRKSEVTPVGMSKAKEATDVIPSADWDLADIWYATSEDGFTWEEQGIAVARPPKPQPGWRSVTTTDILKWKGKYYLYFQAFMEASGLRGDFCPVSVAYADSPDGPWTHTGDLVIPNGPEGTWDQFQIHDPYPLVHDGKIYIYYKAGFDKRNEFNPSKVLMQGLVIAENPLGPFEKHPLNPLINSGHETTLFPFREGVAAIIQRNGHEHNTIQYAKDWVNFEVVSNVELLPLAAGPYVPDAFTDTKDGRGITWGISHFIKEGPDKSKNYQSVLTRFDCDLSLDLHDPQMKEHYTLYGSEVHYRQGLSKAQRQRIKEANAELLNE